MKKIFLVLGFCFSCGAVFSQSEMSGKSLRLQNRNVTSIKEDTTGLLITDTKALVTGSLARQILNKVSVGGSLGGSPFALDTMIRRVRDTLQVKKNGQWVSVALDDSVRITLNTAGDSVLYQVKYRYGSAFAFQQTIIESQIESYPGAGNTSGVIYQLGALPSGVPGGQIKLNFLESTGLTPTVMRVRILDVENSNAVVAETAEFITSFIWNNPSLLNFTFNSPVFNPSNHKLALEVRGNQHFGVGVRNAVTFTSANGYAGGAGSAVFLANALPLSVPINGGIGFYDAHFRYLAPATSEWITLSKVKIGAGDGTNIYNSNGIVTSNRVVSGGNKDLSFVNLNNFNLLQNSKGLSFKYTDDNIQTIAANLKDSLHLKGFKKLRLDSTVIDSAGSIISYGQSVFKFNRNSSTTVNDYKGLRLTTSDKNNPYLLSVESDYAPYVDSKVGIRIGHTGAENFGGNGEISYSVAPSGGITGGRLLVGVNGNGLRVYYSGKSVFGSGSNFTDAEPVYDFAVLGTSNFAKKIYCDSTDNSTLSTVPEGKIAMYPLNSYGENKMAFQNSNDTAYYVEKDQAYVRAFEMQPGSGGAPATIGNAAFANIGTVSHPVLSVANYVSLRRRINYATTATAGTFAGFRSAQTEIFRGADKNQGGFRVVITFSLNTLVAGMRGFIGVSSSIANPVANDPLTSTADAKVGVAFNSNTGNLSIIHNVPGVAPTVIPTNANHSVSANIAYQLILYSKTNDNKIFWSLKNLSVNAPPLFGNITTNFPAAQTFLAPYAWVTNNATASISAIDIINCHVTTQN